MNSCQAFLLAVAIVGLPAQARNASDVLREMRTALGGESALDAIQTLSMSGSITKTQSKYSRSMSLDVLAILPDHFMTIQHDSDRTGPLAVDVTYYNGFKGAELIRRTDANIPFPPDPGEQTPAAIAQRRAENLLRQQQMFARLCLVLLGKSVPSYPLQFTAAGVSSIDGRAADVVEGHAPDGFAVKLYVDSTTRLPIEVSWEAPARVLITTSMSSQVATRGGQVVSQSPAEAGPVPTLRPPGHLVTWHLVASDFKLQNGLNWPRRLRVLADRELDEDMRLGSFKINPKLDSRRFDVGK